MQTDYCPTCGSNDVRERYPSLLSQGDRVAFSYSFSPECSRTYRVVECLACTHQFCTPLPEQIADHYRDVVDDIYLTQKAARQRTYQGVLPFIASHSTGKRLLDVGCATGDFLEAASSHGFSASGLEPSIWSSTIAANRGFKVHQLYVERLSTLNEEFDIATLWGVIEHFPDPLGALTSICENLSEKGIVVLWTGDVSSITSRVLGRRWWYWQGQHIQYFTRRSMEVLGKRAGFSSVKFHTFPISVTPATLNNSLSRYRMHRVLISLLPALFLGRKTLTIRIPGEMLAVLCK